MRPQSSILLAIAAALTVGGLALGDASTPATQPATTQPAQAVDLGNTICPVSGDKVGDSKVVEVYEGKVYHLCCADCPKDFQKDPEKYAKAVQADPAKYGIK
jgi:YHS domain-containing protein